MSREDRQRPFTRASQTVHGYFSTLFDFSFTRFITVQMFPVLYGVILMATLIGVAYFTVEAFLSSWWRGLFYLLIAGPMAFITIATITRALMEFYLVVFRIYEDMNDIRVVTNRLSGLSESVESVAGLTRRFPFLNPAGTKPKEEPPEPGGNTRSRRKRTPSEPFP